MTDTLSVELLWDGGGGEGGLFIIAMSSWNGTYDTLLLNSFSYISANLSSREGH